MAEKFHITEAGEPARCTASVRDCPRGGADRHFGTPEAARGAFEAEQAGESLPKPRKLSELSALAKTATTEAELEEVVTHGSNATLKALAKNPQAPKSTLLKAHAKTEDPATKEQLELHSNFPVGATSPEGFYKKVLNESSRVKRNQLLQDPEITLSHYQRIRDSAEGRMLAPHILKSQNKLTTSEVVKEVEEIPALFPAAMLAGRYPAEALATADENLIYWGDAMKAPAKYTEPYAVRAVNSRNSVLARGVLENENTTDEALRRLIEGRLEPEKAYRHPSASQATRELFEVSGLPTVRVEMLNRAAGGKLREELVLKNQESRSRSGLNQSSITLDKARIEELQLTEDEIKHLFDADSANAGFSYDSQTGVLKTAIDSGD